MRIIRPYGRSATRPGAGDGAARVRVLRLREVPGGGGSAEREIAPFASSEDALVIAQWISTIDKIATKPKGDKKPTQAQRDLRERLGEAGWDFIVEKKLLPGLADDRDGDLKKLWKKLWDFKIAPYPDGTYTPSEGKQPPSPKGRWYARFAGDVAPEDVNAAEVAASIHEHLYTAAYRMADGRPNHPKGRIAARAESIAGNALSLGGAGAVGQEWTDGDCRTYATKAGNIAGEILEAARAREAEKRRVWPDVAAKVLHEAWPKLFDGAALSFEEARERSPGLVALHEAIRDRYSRTLKRHGKDQESHGTRRRQVSTLLPATMEALFALVDRTLANRNLAALVRLGKVIHYEAATAEDKPADVVNHWPPDVSGSRYWTSNGQAEIKRNEAFVRIWRHSLALARQTLVDWADPQGQIMQDILGKPGIEEATGEKRFDAERHARKLKLLFGSRSALFTDGRDDAFKKETLRVALEGVRGLRNSSFHFKGLGGFSQALGDLKASGDVLAAIRDLWAKDIKGRANRLKQTMVGAKCDYLFKKEQNRKLFEAVIGAAGDVPLPRFRRLLERAHNIAGNGAIRLKLPPPANRLALQKEPARLCQYVALKLLYEHPFRGWLGRLDTATLNGFIDRAVKRTKEAAQGINARNNKDRREVITARAKKLGRLAEGETIQDFLERLTAETASEMRVQRGYASDAESARKQADYIEHLRCDVLAQAFEKYLDEQGFRFVTDLRPDTAQPERPPCALDSLSPTAADTEVENWRAVLYFLLHLVPVEEAGRLLHQIRKWDLLAGKAEGPPPPATRAKVQPITQALELYLDMHDAKFEGGEAVKVIEGFKQLFENATLFDQVFPPAEAGAEDERLPLRGLREILRFGNLKHLLPIFQQNRITQADVDKVRADETSVSGSSPIAEAQAKREGLHEKWSKKRKEFTGSDRRAYVEALASVMAHRHLAAQVRLVNHVRLHHLMMAVLGRLVDFSGLWERDLYFAMLALLYRKGLSPQEAFQGDGLNKLGRGQVVEACRKLDDPAIKDSLAVHFASATGWNGEQVGIRNNFAHFNMLRGSASLHLTRCVNDARRLMAYDRKLKNAVAQAVIELLERDGLALTWTMDTTSAVHALSGARVATRQANHLGSLKLYERQEKGSESKPRYHLVTEGLHGPRFVEMAAALFGG